MGKAEEEQTVPSALASDSAERNAENRRCFRSIRRLVGLKCVLILLLSVALFLSAVFWLPPFLRFGDRGVLDLDSQFKDHDIVATFVLMKPVSFLEDNILQLEDAIYNEISVPSKVVVLSLKPLKETNRTQVVFSIDPLEKHKKLSEAQRSLVREPFKALVIHELDLQLTTLFGVADNFEVLKFSGGITIIPRQHAFLLQKAQIRFNFTLNFSIHQVQDNFNKLKIQLTSGLNLALYENLYISLTNSRGSTVSSPTIVQSFVVLAVGNPTQRLKQLAKTITNPHSRNLGLNNTVFGKVKQVRLSSTLPPDSRAGGNKSPSPAPVPQPEHHHHHHHHHHNHHNHHHHDHHHIAPTAPASPPESWANRGSTPYRKRIHWPEIGAPAPEAEPPGCQFGYRSKGEERRRPRSAPAAAPLAPLRVSLPPRASEASPPRKHESPSKPASNSVPVSSPLPSVVFAHSQPPSKSEPAIERSRSRPEISPTPSTSSSGSLTAIRISVISLFLAFILQL